MDRIDRPYLHVAARRILDRRQAAFAWHTRRHLRPGLGRQPLVPVVPPRSPGRRHPRQRAALRDVRRAPGVRGGLRPPTRSVMAGSLNPLGGRGRAGARRLPLQRPGHRTCQRLPSTRTWLMAGAWVHRDGEKSWIDGRPEMIAGLHADVERDDRRHVVDDRACAPRAATTARTVDVIVPTERTYEWPEPPAMWDAGPAAQHPDARPARRSASPRRSSAPPAAPRQQFVELARHEAPDRRTRPCSPSAAYAQMAVGRGRRASCIAAEDTLRSRRRASCGTQRRARRGVRPSTRVSTCGCGW